MRLFYEVNKKIIDLSNPLMTKEAEEMLGSMMYAPIDPTDRNMSNLYRIICENDVDDLKDETKFSNFFSSYQNLINLEKKGG